jgi:hypothetical protein
MFRFLRFIVIANTIQKANAQIAAVWAVGGVQNAQYLRVSRDCEF